MEAVVMVELVGHLLEGPAMAAFAIGAVEGEIIVYHLVANDIGELLLGKVVIVGNGDDGVIDVLVEPSALVVLEIAAGVFGGEQEIEIGSRKFSPEVFRVTLLENHWHIIVIGYHIRWLVLSTAKISISPQTTKDMREKHHSLKFIRGYEEKSRKICVIL